MSTDASQFGEELRLLKDKVVAMGRLAEQRVRLAFHGLAQRDPDALQRVIAGDDTLDLSQIDIDERCLNLLARFQPVAVDLRGVISALRINTDLERVGDLAVNIAEAGQRYLQHPPVKALVDVTHMADVALLMLRDAIDAFVARDGAAAQEVLRQDDWLHALTSQIVRELLTCMLDAAPVIESGVELILIAGHVKRIADHATNIAEDVIFIVQGRDIRHRSGPPPGLERRSPKAIRLR